MFENLLMSGGCALWDTQCEANKQTAFENEQKLLLLTNKQESLKSNYTPYYILSGVLIFLVLALIIYNKFIKK